MKIYSRPDGRKTVFETDDGAITLTFGRFGPMAFGGEDGLAETRKLREEAKVFLQKLEEFERQNK